MADQGDQSRRYALATASGLLAIAVLLVVVVVGVVIPAATAACQTTGPLVPAYGAYLGGNEADLGALEGKAGQQLGLDRVYSSWGDPQPAPPLLADQAAGRLSALSINPGTISFDAIASGSQDAAIRAQATGLKQFGRPLLLTFNHEPSQNGPAAAPTFTAAWRHYVDVFRAEGVTNVSWALILVASAAGDPWYPGDGYVDWIGADGYSWAGDPDRPGEPWRSFQQVFADFVAWATPHGKPLLIGETAAGADPSDPTRRAQWLRDAAAQVKAWPQIKALAWYERGDWQKLTTPAEVQAWADLAADPYFQARPPAATAPDAPPALTAPTGQEAPEVWAALVTAGLTEVAAAGVMGNMQSESGFDPFILQRGGRSMNPADAGGGGYGLVQWTPGARLVPLLHGAPPSIVTEVAALVEELRTTETTAADALASAGTPEQAADAFGQLYERYAGPPQPIRATQAGAIYAQYAGTVPVGSTSAAGACGPTGGGTFTGDSTTTPQPCSVVPDPSTGRGCLTPRMLNIYTQLAAQGWHPTCWDPHPQNPDSDHPLGRACDAPPGAYGQMPTPEQKARGDALAASLIASAAQTGISYLIWYGQIWSVAHADEGWRPYDGGGVYDPASITGGHYDHVHISTF